MVENQFFKSRNIFITLTTRCNAFCKKCVTRYHRLKNAEMPFHILQKIETLLIENNYSGYISCGTGETLTFSNLKGFIKNIIENTNSRFRILSNGMLVNPDLEDFLFDKRIVWGITLDGFYNEDLTSLQYGVDIELVKNNIKKICEKGNADNIYLNYTLNSKNFDSLKPYIDFAYECGIKEIYCTKLKVFEGFESLNSYKLSKKQKSNLIELENYAKSLGFSFVGFETSEMTNFDKCYLKENKVSPIIDADGTVAFCYGREDKFVGNILDDNVFIKWNNLLEALKNNKNNWCDSCYSRISDNGCFKISKIVYPYITEKGHYNGFKDN